MRFVLIRKIVFYLLKYYPCSLLVTSITRLQGSDELSDGDCSVPIPVEIVEQHAALNLIERYPVVAQSPCKLEMESKK